MQDGDCAVRFKEQGCHRLADDVRAPDNNCVLPAQVTECFVQEVHATGWGARGQNIKALAEATDVLAMEPIDVLLRVDCLNDYRLVDVPREGKLYQYAMHSGILIEYLNHMKNMGLAGVRTNLVLQRRDPTLFSTKYFVAHIDFTRRIIANENHCEARLDATGLHDVDIALDLSKDFSCCNFTVDQ